MKNVLLIESFINVIHIYIESKRTCDDNMILNIINS